MDNDLLRELVDDVRVIKLAVSGDTTLGVPGLVKRVKGLEAWRDQMNLKVAFYSGVGCAIMFVLKWVITGHL